MNEISRKANELIDSIKNSETYIKYESLKKRMLNDKEILDLIDEVKALQKELVKKKIKDSDKKEIVEINKKIDNLLTELNNIPLYYEYDSTQRELNYIMQNIKNTIESCINDITK